MPSYSPPRRLRTDNIKRVLTQRTTEGLLRALATLRGKSGLWPENDPEAYAAYLRDLLNDPRLRRTREERIPADHRDASLRLDRCLATRLTLSCTSCRSAAVYTVDDLRASFGDDHNMTRLPEYLLPCPSKRDRCEGACQPRVEPGGYDDRVLTVAEARAKVS